MAVLRWGVIAFMTILSLLTLLHRVLSTLPCLSFSSRSLDLTIHGLSLALSDRQRFLNALLFLLPAELYLILIA